MYKQLLKGCKSWVAVIPMTTTTKWSRYLPGQHASRLIADGNKLETGSRCHQWHRRLDGADDI